MDESTAQLIKQANEQSNLYNEFIDRPDLKGWKKTLLRDQQDLCNKLLVERQRAQNGFTEINANYKSACDHQLRGISALLHPVQAYRSRRETEELGYKMFEQRLVFVGVNAAYLNATSVFGKMRN
jgi:gamma-glutamyl:cysteine ligase YbdK (ATP-grasp superfamily)